MSKNKHLDDFPRLHERTMVLEQARIEVAAALIDIRKKHELTLMEEVSVLLPFIQTCVKYAIREERHPNDPDKRGDEA